MYCMTLSGKVTYETCPVCDEPEVKVEHGQQTKLVLDESGHVVEDVKLGPMHYSHCPNCGDSTAVVCYDCPLCKIPHEKGG